MNLRFTGLEIPAAGRDEFTGAGLATFAAFALTGLFTWLAPGIVGSLLYQANDAVQGAVSCIIFAGSLPIANRLAPQGSRGQVISTYFVFAYAGLIIPVVGVGFASDYVGDFPGGARLFHRAGRTMRIVGHRHLRVRPCGPDWPSCRSSHCLLALTSGTELSCAGAQLRCTRWPRPSAGIPRQARCWPARPEHSVSAGTAVHRHRA